MQSAAKVGLLVVVFVGLLIGAFTVLGKSLFAPVPTLYFADFEDAGGTTPGTKILMAGVPIGEVESVELRGPKSARMTLAINSKTLIPVGSVALLPTAFIGFGESPIQILPPDEPVGGTLVAGAVLRGVKKGPLEGLLPDSKDTVKELNRTIVAARKLLEDERLKTSMNALINKGSKTIEQFGALASQAQQMVADNRLAIKGIVAQAQLAMSDVRKSTRMLAKLVDDPRYKRDAAAILDSLKATARKADELASNLNALVTDPRLRDPLNNVVANADRISASGTRIAETTEKIATNTEKITSNGVSISEEVLTLSKKVNVLADEAREVLQKVKGFFDRTPGKGGIKPLEVGMDLLRETRPNYWRTDLSAEIGVPGSKTSYHVGLFDAFESNKITLQVGRSIGGANQVRYGIYASKPGVGVDYRLGTNIEMRTDLFNINDPRLDLRFRYDFGNGIVGWAGLADLLGRNSPSIGVGVRR